MLISEGAGQCRFAEVIARLNPRTMLPAFADQF
jgi:hypothetical protein